MKKYLAILFAVAMLCGCSDKNNSSSAGGSTVPAATDDLGNPVSPGGEATTQYVMDTSYEDPIIGTDVDMSEVENVDWSLIYRDAIEEFRKTDKCDETARFTVYDINDDKIPELIFSYGPGDARVYEIRSLSSENIYTEFEPIEHCDYMIYTMNRSLLSTFKYDYENSSQAIQFYRLKNSKMANVFTLGMKDNICLMNGEECTEDEYFEEYTKLYDGVNKPMGTDFGFDDETIDAALGNCDSWEKAYSAVLNDYLKYKNSSDLNRFSVMDINGDDIPELFVSGGAPYDPYVDVYSWNGCAVPVNCFSGDVYLYYFQDSKKLWSDYKSGSLTAGTIYTFNDVYKFDKIFSYADDEVAHQNEENATDVQYKINNEDSNKDDYKKQVEENTKGNPYALGQDNEVTEETVKQMAEGKFTAPSLRS